MIIIATKPESLINLVADPLTGNVNIVFNPNLIKLYGPAYPMIVRQQLENALKVVSKLESNVSAK